MEAGEVSSKNVAQPAWGQLRRVLHCTDNVVIPRRNFLRLAAGAAVLWDETVKWGKVVRDANIKPE